MDRTNKPRIGIFVNKNIPRTDYRVASATRLIDRAQFDFIFPNECDGATSSQFKCRKVVFGEGIHLFKDVIALFQLWFVLRRQRYDIVHFFSTKYILLGPIIARLAGRKKAIITVTGLGRTFSSQMAIHKLLRPLYLFFFRISAQLSTYVLFQNNDDYQMLSNKFRSLSRRFHVIGSSVELDSYSSHRAEKLDQVEEYKIQKEENRIVSVTRLFPDKGVREYIEIAKRLKVLYGRNIKLFLIGPPSRGQEDLLEEVLTAQKDGVIEYLGERTDVLAFLSTCEIFVFCSYREGMPRAILEAQGMGLPCVAFDVPGCRDVILDGETGFLIKNRDISEMVTRISTLVENRDMQKAFKEAAKSHFKETYSIDKFTEHLLFYYGLDKKDQMK